MSEDFLLEDEDLYQQPEDDDLRETLNKHLNDTEHDREVVHKTMHALTDVMISTSRDYDLAMNCKCVLMEFYRRQGLNEEEEIARIDAHAHNLDEFDKFMKARNGDLNPKRISEQEFAHALDQLMESVDASNHYIFKIQRHWIAVFRVAADMQLIGENDYLGFCKWIKKIHPASFRVKVTQGDLKQISNSDCYMKPYEKWKFVPMGNVKKKPYDAMVNVVDYLKKLLEKEGKVA